MRFGKSVHNCFLTQPEIVQAAFGVAQIELCAVQFVSEPVAFADGFCKLAFNVFNFNTRRRKLCAQRIVFLRKLGELLLHRLCFFAHHCVALRYYFYPPFASERINRHNSAEKSLESFQMNEVCPFESCGGA